MLKTKLFQYFILQAILAGVIVLIRLLSVCNRYHFTTILIDFACVEIVKSFEFHVRDCDPLAGVQVYTHFLNQQHTFVKQCLEMRGRLVCLHQPASQPSKRAIDD